MRVDWTYAIVDRLFPGRKSGSPRRQITIRARRRPGVFDSPIRWRSLRAPARALVKQSRYGSRRRGRTSTSVSSTRRRTARCHQDPRQRRPAASSSSSCVARVLVPVGRSAGVGQSPRAVRHPRQQRRDRARRHGAHHDGGRSGSPVFRERQGRLFHDPGVFAGDAARRCGSVVNLASIGGIVAVRDRLPISRPSSRWSA